MMTPPPIHDDDGDDGDRPKAATSPITAAAGPIP